MASTKGELPGFAQDIVNRPPLVLENAPINLPPLVLENAPINLPPRSRPNPLATMTPKTFYPGQRGIGQFFDAGLGASPQGDPQAQLTGNVPLPGGGINFAGGLGADDYTASLNAQMGNENLMAQIRAAMNKDDFGASTNVSGGLNAPFRDSSAGIGAFYTKFDSASNIPNREDIGAGVTASTPFLGGTLSGDAGWGSQTGAKANVGWTRRF
jgi:hypothetical protein